MKTATPSKVCTGSGSPVTVEIVNDWWVGTTTVCPTCSRGGLKPTKGNTAPRHNDYRSVTP